MQSDVNRRRAQRQKKARRRQLKVLFIFFLIIALITLVILCFTVFFKVKGINVSGSKIYSKAQIIKASGITTDDGLFLVSEDDVEQNIRKKLSYVDNVELKRVFPDKIQLIVTDAKEYAYYQSGEKFFILSENGYVLKEQTETPENVFQIVTSGVEGRTGQKATYKNNTEEQLVNTVINILQKKGVNIDKIDVSNILEISLEVEGRFTVALGNSDYIEEKIAHLKGMLDSIPDRKGRINLSMWKPTNCQGSFIEETG